MTDHDDIVKELRAIRRWLPFFSLMLFFIFLAIGPCNQLFSSQSEPPSLRLFRRKAVTPFDSPGSVQPDCSILAEPIRVAAAAVANRCTLLTEVPLLSHTDRGVGDNAHNLCPLPGKEPHCGGTSFGLKRLDGRTSGRTFFIPAFGCGKITGSKPSSKNVVLPAIGRLLSIDQKSTQITRPFLNLRIVNRLPLDGGCCSPFKPLGAGGVLPSPGSTPWGNVGD